MKKKKKWLWIALSVLAVIGLLVSGYFIFALSFVFTDAFTLSSPGELGRSWLNGVKAVFVALLLLLAWCIMRIRRKTNSQERT